MKFNISKIVILFLFPPLLFSQNLTVSKLPHWITEIEAQVSTTVKSSSVSDGYFYTLVDRQFNLSTETEFGHYTRKIFNKDGVQNASEITISFDPSFQKLIFHNISVWRDGKKINKLDLSKFQVIQKEQDHDRHLYDGSLTAIMVLEDIRIGDFIDYSFSRKGFNPIYKEKFFNTFNVQYGDPLDRLFLKIVAPTTRKLTFTSENGEVKPLSETKGKFINHVVELKNIKGLTTEDYLPSWYQPYHRFSVSEYLSWNEFGKWISPIYKLENLSKEFENKAAELTKGTDSQKEKALRLIRFVQNEIRYTGFEGGISGYKPHSPLKVLNQRFGDCKDKSWLLVHLLKTIGVEAYPVLVNTLYKDKVEAWQPTAYAFDHCITKVVVDNQSIWIDPTISSQGGDLFNTYFPNYKLGYVIEEASGRFESIPVSGGSKTDVKETVHLDKVGGGCTYEIETSYYGADADSQRSYFYSTALTDIQKSYLNYYSSNFPDIDTLTLVTFKDDTIQNVFVTLEKYLVTDLWKKDQNDTTEIKVSFFPISLNSLFRIPSTKNRKMPMALNYPSEYHQVTEIHLPEPWTIKKESKSINNGNFSYEENKNYQNQTCYLVYHYKSLKDVVEVADFKQYLKDVTKITDVLNFQFTYKFDAEWETQSSTSGVWVMVLFYLIGCSVGIFFCNKLLYYNPESKVTQDNFSYERIGGWLVLVAIIVVMSPIRILIGMGQLEYFDIKMWKSISFASTIGLFFLIEAVFNLFSFFVYVLLAYLFFNKRTSFPRIFIITLISVLVFHLLDHLFINVILKLAEPDSEDMKTLIQTIISTAIWVPYMWNSQRVKGTFIHNL